MPTHALSDIEEQEILDAFHIEEFSPLPPDQIVPKLADKGIYLASEPTFYRILKKHSENARKGRLKYPTRINNPQLVANALNNI